MINEHEQVVLTVDLPQYRLKAGDIGAIVHVYRTSKAYEIEFFTAEGETLDVVTVEADQVRPVTRRDVMRART